MGRTNGTYSRRDLLRLASLAGIGMAAGAVVSACAPKPTAVPAQQPTAAPAPKKEEVKPTEKPAEAKPATKAPVTIQLHLRAGGDLAEPAIYVMRPAEFMKEYPHIKVELAPIPGGEYEAKVQTMAASKTLGDVMWSSVVFGYHPRLMKQNIIMPVDDYLDKYKKSKSEWLTPAVEGLTYQGKMRGLPKCCHPSVSHIWINEDMFQEAGLPVPEIYNHTHQEIMDWAKKLAKGPEADRQVYGYSFGGTGFEYNYSAIRSFGGWEYDKEGKQCLADTPEWWEWAQWVNTFYRSKLTPWVPSLPTGGEQALFAAKKVGMVAGGRWMHKRIVAAVKAAGNPFKWRVIQSPRGPKANGWISCVDTHSATMFTKYPEESFLLSYALADKRFSELVAETQGYLTARVDDIDVVKKLGDPFLELQYKNMTLEETLRQPDNTRGSEVQTALDNELQKIWLGDVPLTQAAMKSLKAAVDAVLAKPF